MEKEKFNSTKISISKEELEKLNEIQSELYLRKRLRVRTSNAINFIVNEMSKSDLTDFIVSEQEDRSNLQSVNLTNKESRFIDLESEKYSTSRSKYIGAAIKAFSIRENIFLK